MAEERAKARRMTLTLPCHPMERRDILPIVLITAIYAGTAFFMLGDLSGPQSCAKLQQGDCVGFSYDRPETVTKLSFYTSLGTGHYTLEWEDEDGDWQSIRLDQPYNSLFKWQVLELDQVDRDGKKIDAEDEGKEPVGAITASRFRLTASNAPGERGCGWRSWRCGMGCGPWCPLRWTKGPSPCSTSGRSGPPRPPIWTRPISMRSTIPAPPWSI